MELRNGDETSSGVARGTVPNFFLVGAPKCGTTSMAAYLGSHPEVFMSDPKEPNFFCEDLPDTREVTSLSGYLNLFPTKDPPAVVGEASTWYLYSEVAARRIRDFNPTARILAMVRNPVDLVYSLHAQLLYNQIETEENFERAWGLQTARRGRNFLQYRKVGSLGSQVERLFSVFPRPQVKVVVFDDFVESTPKIYRDVLEFLGLEPDDRRRFPALNRSKKLRSSRLAGFVRDTPEPLVRLARWAKRLLSVERFGFLEKVQALNTKQESRPPLSDEFRAALVDEFRPEVDKLERLLDRDLSAWKYT